MCGIAGIIGLCDEPRRQALRRMADALAHRGPDGQGFWESPADDHGWGCLLAHRRLTILDLTDAAAQPMIHPASRHVLTFNGEIYNYRQIRSQLESDGERFTSSGDTEVLLRLLALRSPGATDRLRGMFAFAMWDDDRRELMLARDPLGIKPLYLAQNPDPNGSWSLAFASEVRALVASGLLGRSRLDPAAVATYVWNGFIPGPGTAVKGVASVWPGEYRLFDRRGLEVDSRTYWSLPPAGAPKADRLDVVRESLSRSCRLHLISDVPLGLFLSSGVDSSAVANISQKMADQRLRTFTLAFEESEYSEGPIARRIAEAIGTDHTEIRLSESEFIGQFGRAIRSIDQPTFDALNVFFVSWAVRQAGIKVALMGTGGDELVGGYTSFRDLPKLMALAAGTRWVPRPAKVAVAEAVGKVLSGRRPKGAIASQTRWAKLPAMVASGADTIALYQLAYALFLPDFQAELLADGPASVGLRDGLPAPLRERLEAEISGRTPLEAISALEQRCFLAERLLRDGDSASMAVSLELRVPLVDQEVVDAFFRLDDATRYEPVRSKRLLRQIGLEGLDPALFNRPKQGFVLPFDRWIRQNLASAIDETFHDRPAVEAVGLQPGAVLRLWESYRSGAPGLYWSRVWSLYVLIHWCQLHGLRL
jgi:asparagine synthase (glutamine-hydrolysing)